MSHGLIGLVVALAVAQQGPTVPVGPAGLSLRELAWHADTVVVAVPLDPKKTLGFKVQRVIKGRPVLGQEIQVEGVSFFFPTQGELQPARVLEYCLFLTADPEGPSGQKFRLVPTGLAGLGKDGSLYRPLEGVLPGESQLVQRGKAKDWDALLGQVQSDVEELQRLERARALPLSRGRNQALLDWIVAHRRDFQQSQTLDRDPSNMTGGSFNDRSWGILERLPFRWVLQSGILPDCWQAIELYAEISSGAVLGLKEMVFNSQEGRAFLVRMASEEHQLDGSRQRALRLLATAHTLRGKSALDSVEQTELLERLRPLLQARSAGLRSQAAKTILEVSRPLGEKGEFSRKLLPELIAAYKAEPAGVARDALAEAVCNVGGEKEWQGLTGQPMGLAAAIQTPRARQDQVLFWVVLRGREVRVTEVPTLLLERLDPAGKVLEKKSEPLPTTLPQPGGWAGGWDGSVPLLVEFVVQPLELGNWRMRVEGVSGKERHRWQSEPRLFKVVPVGRPDGLVPVDPKVKVRRIAEVPPEE